MRTGKERVRQCENRLIESDLVRAAARSGAVMGNLRSSNMRFSENVQRLDILNSRRKCPGQDIELAFAHSLPLARYTESRHL